jgi:hypothetical protein
MKTVPHVLTDGSLPVKPFTEVEKVFTRYKLKQGEKVFTNPLASGNGASSNKPQVDKVQDDNIKSCLKVRAELIAMVESYTGKPIDVFAREVREWRQSLGEQPPFRKPFPSTAYQSEK